MRYPLLLVLLLSTAAPAVRADADDPYRALAFLAGHCWKGTFPDGKQTDEHCFEWVYGNRFLRDRHVVRGGGHADFQGETLYFWDSAAARLEYLYIESQGGFSRGSVAVDGAALVFPDAEYTDQGKRQTYRSRWRRSGADAYDVATEFKGENGWAPGFALHMVLQ